MRFSIITITYNAQAYLADTLESLLSQDFTDYEHLIWDGGSTDQTLAIAREFPVKIYEGKDRGIADAMNKGAFLAKGDYLLHLHADDLLAHERVLSFIDTCLKQHPSGWLYGRADVIDANGKRLRTTPYIPFEEKRLRKYNMITHPATIVSRELFMSVEGFNPNLNYCMDYDLWIRLAQVTKPFALDAVLAFFREHDHSCSTREPLAVADEAYKVRNSYVRFPWERWKSYRTWKKRREEILG